MQLIEIENTTRPLNQEEKAYLSAWAKIRSYIKATYKGRFKAVQEIDLASHYGCTSCYYCLGIEPNGNAYLRTTYATSVFDMEGNPDDKHIGANKRKTKDVKCFSEANFQCFRLVVDQWINENLKEQIASLCAHKESVYNFQV